MTLNPVSVIPNDLQPNDLLGFKVVAVIYSGGFWAAYRGLTYWSDEQVATSGDKISEDVARSLFYAPDAAGLKYNS